jgi:hypothetical protein
MEHRWGQRIGVDLPVRITAHPYSVKHARINNLSVSGASLRADFDLRPLSRIRVFIEMPRMRRFGAPGIAAYVTRVGKTSIGIEWCEFAPRVVSEILAVVATRPYIRMHKPEPALGTAITRICAPLLKHGT